MYCSANNTEKQRNTKKNNENIEKKVEQPYLQLFHHVFLILSLLKQRYAILKPPNKKQQGKTMSIIDKNTEKTLMLVIVSYVFHAFCTLLIRYYCLMFKKKSLFFPQFFPIDRKQQINHTGYGSEAVPGRRQLVKPHCGPAYRRCLGSGSSLNGRCTDRAVPGTENVAKT